MKKPQAGEPAVCIGAAFGPFVTGLLAAGGCYGAVDFGY